MEREHFIRLREIEECDFYDLYSDKSEDIGAYGEKLTVFELELLKVKGYNGDILNNLYIPYNNGKTSEIDILFITRKGIFVIESKNYSGWIYGSENDKYWTVCDYMDKWKLYNPIKQNQGHIHTIHQHLRGIPCFSLIVFSERCELKKINVNSDVYVFKRDKMFFKVSEIFKNFPDIMDDSQVKYVTDYLKQFCNADKNIKTSHVDEVTNY
ncbi:MAG: NERD domain-containing protein [Ruminococcus sp.]|nr:NERD domain-containing protein [Ruminococcus sp.]